MKKIYFDSNIYAEIVRRDIKYNQIKDILSRRKLRLIISSLNVFEIASCWKSGDLSNIEQGIKRFKLIKGLFPCRFLNTIPKILLMELDNLINDVSFSPFCENQEKADFEREIDKFSNGIYDDKAKKFIENRWAEKSNDIQSKISELTKNKGQFKYTNEFKGFLVKNRYLQKLIAEGIVAERVRDISNKDRRKIAEKILSKSRRFPMIVSVIKANLFLDYRVLKFGNLSHDTLDDLKHLINASYADMFVTGDNKLFDYSKELHPNLETLFQDDFLEVR